jgi:hypothetical protein
MSFILTSGDNNLHQYCPSYIRIECMKYIVITCRYLPDLLQYKNYVKHSPVTDLSGLPLPVNIPCVYTAIETRCYQQTISWREFYVLYPVGVTMKSSYLRLQITSIPQCYSTIVTACRKNTGIQEPNGYNT